MTLALIGAGWPRTGTGSLKLAYEQLGLGRCYHMREVMMNVASIEGWLRAADGRPDWDAIFAGYTATTDTPACVFWRELVAYYPTARVLLSVRDPEEWFRSTQATVFSPQLAGRRPADSPLAPFFEKVVHRDFGERIHDHDFMVGAFQRHNDEVRRTVPADRLLVYEVGDGWGPLCRFLGVAAPDTPFPHTNAREEMQAMFAGGVPSDLKRIQEAATKRFGRPDESR